MKRSALRNFHVPLPEDVYGQLREEAQRSGQPATALARDAIQRWLREKRKPAIHEEIASYAARHGGTAVDLDKELESTSVEGLLIEEGSLR